MFSVFSSGDTGQGLCLTFFWQMQTASASFFHNRWVSLVPIFLTSPIEQQSLGLLLFFTCDFLFINFPSIFLSIKKGQKNLPFINIPLAGFCGPHCLLH